MSRDDLEAAIRREMTGAVLAASQRGLSAATERMNSAVTECLNACDRYAAREVRETALDAVALRAAISRSDTTYNQAERRAMLAEAAS